MRKKPRQIVVWPYTDVSMESKMKMIMDRINELQALLEEGRGDHKFIYSMLELNEQILFLLMHKEEVRFYKHCQELSGPEHSIL